LKKELPLSLENTMMEEKSSKNPNSNGGNALELGMGIASNTRGDISLKTPHFLLKKFL